MATELTTATAPITRVGAFHRDGKLTREDLLARYQSYLVQELETVSWNLYGERDYAKHTIFFLIVRCETAALPPMTAARFSTNEICPTALVRYWEA
jgi:hypothetical protein